MGQDGAIAPQEIAGEGDATQLVKLTSTSKDCFTNLYSESFRNNHLFGGQVVAQALAAAATTVEGRHCHSMHAYFLRAGSASASVSFEVDRTRDGGRFSTRRVVALQNDVPILHLECSFHFGERGLEHQVPSSVPVPEPETIPDITALDPDKDQAALWGIIQNVQTFPLLDIRIVDQELLLQPNPDANRRLWIRVPSAVNSDDPAVHQQLVAYISDFMLAGVALLPHPVKYRWPRTFMASLDHAIWFHRPCRVDDWLLYDCDSPSTGDGRGIVRGQIKDRTGRLIATVMQEALLRPDLTL